MAAPNPRDHEQDASDLSRMVNLVEDLVLCQESVLGLTWTHDHMMSSLLDAVDEVEILRCEQTQLLTSVQALARQLRARGGTPTAAEALLLALADAANEAACDHRASPFDRLATRSPGQVQSSAHASPGAASGAWVPMQGHGSSSAGWRTPGSDELNPMDFTGSEVAPSAITTLMVRHAVRDWSQEDLLAVWPPTCPRCPYNLLYAPHRKKRSGLQGYLFINFLTPEAAQTFRETWHGRVLNMDRPMEISDSAVQGFDRNFRRFLDDGLTRLRVEWQPVVVIDGVRQDFNAVAGAFQTPRSS